MAGRRKSERHAKKCGAGVFIFFMFFLNSADATISEPGTGYLLQPRSHVDFSLLSHLQSQGKASLGRGCTCYAGHEPTITDRGGGGGGRGVLDQYLDIDEALRV